MKILITGGAGFIGSHLADAYLGRGDEVYIIDDLSTGSLENIKHLQEYRKYKDRLFVKIDTVLNYETMLELVGTCDVVFHLAAAVGVQYILDNPLASITTNISGTELVLKLCNKFRKKVLIASTSEVYGKHDHAPLEETDDCVYGPSVKWRWSYAAMAYHRTNKLPVVIARFFNTVGPRQTGRYGMVIPRFVKQALTNRPLTVYGDGSQTRTFTHIQDAVAAMVKLIANPESIGEVVNIGGSEEVSILTLANLIKDKAGSGSDIQLVPYEEVFPRDFEDMQRRVPSTLKLQKLTGYLPNMDLDRILDDVIAYQQAHTESL